MLSFSWGLQPLGRLGWAAGFLFVTRRGDAAGALQHSDAAGGDKRYFVGMPSPAAAGDPGGDGLRVSGGLHDYRAALPALAMVLVPALLMVSTIRFRSFKTIDLQARRPYTVLILIAAAIAADRHAPAVVLVVLAYCVSRVGVRRAWRSRACVSAGGVECRRAEPTRRLPLADAPAHAERSQGSGTQPSRPIRPDRYAAGSAARQRDRHGRADAALRCRPRSCRRSTRCCASRSSGRGRCRSPWSRSTARRSAQRLVRPCRRPCRSRSTTTALRPWPATALTAGVRPCSVPPPGIACSAFSMMLVSARANSVRSIGTGGRSAAPSTSIAMRPARPVRYGSTTSSISRRTAVGSGRGVGDDAKLENSAEI